MVEMRRVFAFLCLFLGAYAAEVWVTCIPSGSYSTCTGTFDYTGPMLGETIPLDSYTGVDGTYSPLSPVSVSLTTARYELGSYSSYHDFPRQLLDVRGNCLTGIAIDIGNQFGDVSDAYEPYTVNPDYGGCYGVGTISYGTYCPRLDQSVAVGIKQDQGIVDSLASRLNDDQRLIVSLTVLADGLTITKTVDLLNTPTVFTGPMASAVNYNASSADYFFLYKDNVAGTLYVPKNITITDFALAAPMVGQVMWTDYYAGANDPWGYGTCFSQTVRNIELCGKIVYDCDATGVVKVEYFPTLALTNMAALSSTFSVTQSGAALRLSSTLPPANLTTRVSFTAKMIRNPPTVTLSSFTSDCDAGYVAITGTNSGNHGLATFQVSYKSGPPNVVSHIIDQGTFHIRLDSGSITQVCVGNSLSDCLNISYKCSVPAAAAAPGAKDDNSSVWFNPDNKGLFAFEIIMTIVAGLFVIMVSLIVYRRVARWWRMKPRSV